MLDTDCFKLGFEIRQDRVLQNLTILRNILSKNISLHKPIYWANFKVNINRNPLFAEFCIGTFEASLVQIQWLVFELSYSTTTTHFVANHFNIIKTSTQSPFKVTFLRSRYSD
jgi:hypothetical protein